LVRWILTGIVVLFLATGQIRLIHASFGSHLNAHIEAAEGVVEGLPHWRVFQSRVLGPAMVHAATWTGLSREAAYDTLMFVWLSLFFAVVMAAGMDLWRSMPAALAAAGSAAFLNATLMQGEWLYAWDFIDLIVFATLTWAVLREKPLAVIAGIIVLEIFNREAAIIICGWLALDAMTTLVRHRGDPMRAREARRQLIVAIGLAVAGQVIVEALRTVLLVREVGQEIFAEVAGPGAVLGFKLGFNVYELKRWLVTQPNLMLPYGIFVAAIPVAAVFGLLSPERGLARISLLFLILWVFTLLFAVVYETRVWLAFVPFLVLATPLIVDGWLRSRPGRVSGRER
jgi:hypothetical protein